MSPNIDSKRNNNISIMEKTTLSKNDLEGSFSSLQENSERLGGAAKQDQGKSIQPGEHDVLLGRGGGTNNHSGNIRFRQLVNEHKMHYLSCTKIGKPKIAREVVEIWKNLTPPGRFLVRLDDNKGPGSTKASDNRWTEVDEKKAREKASQCLRERTPDMIPYIQKLREHQDSLTQQGVAMFSENRDGQNNALYCQDEERNAYNHDFQANELNPAYMSNMLPSDRVSPPFVKTMNSPALVAAPLTLNFAQQSRRTSLPLVSQYNAMPQVPMSRRISAPHMASQGVAQPDRMFSTSFQTQPTLEEEEAYFASTQNNLADMTEYEYQQKILIMEQQLQLNQLHLQRLQHQRMFARSCSDTIVQCGNGVATNRLNDMRPSLVASGNAAEGFYTGNAALPRRVLDNTYAFQPQQVQQVSTFVNQVTPPVTNEAVYEENKAKHHIEKAVLPPVNVDDAELTLEDYRQKLEKYMSTSNHENELPKARPSSKRASENEPTVHKYNNIAFNANVDDNESDWEDDWDKEKESTMNADINVKRGVSRNASAMSYATLRSSGNSILSGFTNLSDFMVSSQLGETPRHSFSSNLSLMSDMTDLSQNVDTLSLYGE